MRPSTRPTKGRTPGCSKDPLRRARGGEALSGDAARTSGRRPVEDTPACSAGALWHARTGKLFVPSKGMPGYLALASCP